jgi:DNA-binding transcriptional regulator of glucitol operon
VRNKLLTPGWVAAHVLVALFVVACGCLGWWQWQRAESASGTLQNLGYALQWPLFGVAAIYMLRRALRLESQRSDADSVTEPAEQDQRTPVEPASHDRASQPVPALRPATRGQARPGETGEDHDTDGADDELAAYNRYLAQLHERDQRHAG